MPFRECISQIPRNCLLAAGVGLAAVGVGVYLRGLAGAAGLATLGAGVCLMGAAVLRERSRERIKVGTVSKLFIYPVKSCRGVSVAEAQCTKLGLSQGEIKDRHWIVIKEDGHQVTGRQEPRLVLLTASCKDGHLFLNAPDMPEMIIPTKLPKSNPVKNCRVWGADIHGRDCGDEVSKWITTFLKSSQPYRLVQFEPNMVPRKSKDAEMPFRITDEVAYPDASPIMLLSEASVEDLNTRLQKKVTIYNFRPCIVVSGCNAFDEDSWKEVDIGNVRLASVMSCPRCIFTTVDPETGIIDMKEPLETLKSYRLCDPSEKNIYKSSPLFGVYYGVDKTGVMRVGDPVYKLV
ncbi:mitochondrial amidoxime reducing component 2-like [Protopterus annectens]|uniref:mitochondrial amidoxime reducing component 2-like n=1 Tax=Protopterus annectens TaxID=7888 RepID=UPI001CFBDE42|nr:mitochondrial amidoxime reducing component 2-like [Protopterus annectens]